MWMKHSEHGDIADLPDLPYWRNRGWEPTDERPAEPDLLHDPEPDPGPQPEATEAPEDTSGASSFPPADEGESAGG